MSAERWRRVSAIFHAVEGRSAAERDSILAEACGADSELRLEIEALLAAHDRPSAFLDLPAGDLLGGHLQAGDVLCDRFVIVRLLGTGGMGEVWAARDRQLQEDIAIKTVRSTIAADGGAFERFKREIQLARRIAHPNVCRVHDLFEDVSGPTPRLFLTMELIEGETLAARLKREGPVPVEDALAILGQVISGLAAAHAANIVHRDLKPANVMLTSSAARRVVIMDFGLARLFDAAAMTDTTRTAATAIVGTPEYMAPEQISGLAPTAQTDVYALGLILFEMLRGEAPFGGSGAPASWLRRARETPAKLSGVVRGVDRRIDEVIARCLEYEPAKRFRSANDVWADLHRRRFIGMPRGRSLRLGLAAAAVAAAAVSWQVIEWPREAAVPTADALRWHSDAVRELAEGASVRALNSINRAVDASPGFALAHALRAEILLELDMPGRAQEAMLLASAATPSGSSDESYIDGVRELILRNCDSAVGSLRRYGESGPAPERPYRLLSVARALERCGQPDEAQKLLARASDLDPRNAAILARQARLFARQSDYTRALAALDTAEALFRDRTDYEGVCEVLVARGTFQASQDDLDAATATLTKAGDIAESLADLRQQVRIRLQMAIVNRKRGDVTTAERLTKEAVDLAARQSLETLTLEGLFANGNVHLVRNQFDEAASLFDRALAIAENHRHEDYKARAWLSLASVYVRVMEPDKAEQAVQAARPYYERTNQIRNVASAGVLLGQVRIMRAEYPAARTLFEAMLANATKASDREQELRTREDLATVLVAMGRYPDALEEYRRALAGYRESGRTRNEAFTVLNIADTLSRMGRFGEAAAAIREAEGMNPLPVEIQAHLLWVRADDALRQGRYRTASADAWKALDMGAGLSSERMVRARLIACSATARLGELAEAESHCAAARMARGIDRNVRLWLEVELVDAEVKIRAGHDTGLGDRLANALSVVNKSESSADRWRVFALTAARRGDGAEGRTSLTRELDALRLLWGEPIYQSWQRRADVRSLLLMAGVRVPKEAD